jgi:EAL and modified HD-GYP domain-containing signal transduction protein
MITVAMAGAAGAQRSPAITSMVLTRASFCERIAPSLSEDPAQLYLLGMLSLLDVLLQTPFHRILQTLPIGNEMKLALAGAQSRPGLTLALVRSLESCDWGRCEEIGQQLGLAEDTIAALYAESVRWASSMIASETPA